MRYELLPGLFLTTYQRLTEYLETNKATDISELILLNRLPDDLKNKDLFVLDQNGQSFLHKAAVEENVMMIKYLKTVGFNINFLDHRDRTALYYACKSLKLAAVNILCEYDAKPNLGYGENIPLIATIESEAQVSAEELSTVTGEDFSGLTEEQVTEHAAMRIVKKLIEYGVDINFQIGEDYLSPLHRAVVLQKPLIVKEFVNNNVNFALLAKDGTSALHSLVEYRSKSQKQEEQAQMQREKQIADLVIPHSGAVFNLKAEFGNTPLHTAVIGSNADVVETICKNDYLFPQLKLLSIQNDEGNTAIHEAVKEARRGPVVLATLLRLATEDDLAIFNYKGESVLQMAQRLINEAESVHHLVDSIKTKSIELDNFFVGKSSAELEANVADFAEFNKFDQAINELRNCEYFDLKISKKTSDALENIYLSLEKSKNEGTITIEQVEFINEQVTNLLSPTYQKFTPDYMATLTSVKAEKYSEWKQQQMDLPSSFSGLESSPDHHTELAKAHAEYNDAWALSNSGNRLDAKTKLQESIQHYARLQEYTFLEIPYQDLASFSTNTLTAIVAYGSNQQAILRSRSSSSEKKLQAHLALAGLYKVLRKNPVKLPSMTAQELYTQESFHYSEAYKYTQGVPDPAVHIVLQREIGVAHAAQLGTYNIQQCVAVIAHDPGTNKVVLSHFDRYSGPLKFIDQILAEFPNAEAHAKIDLYLTGARDRSLNNKKVSDSNINQVLKQIYAYKERFTIRATDLGDKLSPPAVVFDGQAQNGLRLLQGMPNHPDVSLDSRAAAMNLQFTKGDYLYPLKKIDFSHSAVSRKIIFSVEELQQIHNQFNNFFRDYGDSSSYPDSWKHNQLFQPLLTVMTETADTSVRSTTDHFGQGSLNPLSMQEQIIFAEHPLKDSSLLQQQRMPQNPDLLEVLFHQNQVPLSSHPQPVYTIERFQPLTHIISHALAVLDENDNKWDEQPPLKKICLANLRRKREAQACLFSWEDIDEFNLEKENTRDSEKIIIDSTTFLEHLSDADEAKRTQLLQLAASCQISGEKQSAIRRLFSIERQKVYLHKLGRISNGLTEGMFTGDALLGLFKGDPYATAQWVDFKVANYLLEKTVVKMNTQGLKWITAGKLLPGKLLRAGGPVVLRSFNFGFMAVDLSEQIKALKKDPNNTDAWIGAISDGMQLTTDLGTAGVEVLEISSERLALLGISEVTGPLGEVVVGMIMLGDRIYADIEKVAREDHLLHLSKWEKFTEGWRAFLNLDSAYQKQLDEISEYARILSKQFEFLQTHPKIKHVIFPAIEKIDEKCRRRIIPGTIHRHKTTCSPIFIEVKNNYVYFADQLTGFSLTREEITPFAGSELLCTPTGSDKSVPDSGAYRCDGALGLTNKNSTGTTTFFNLGEGDDHAVGFVNSSNIFMINNGAKDYQGGDQEDTFILVAQEVSTAVNKNGKIGGLNGGAGIDNLMLQGFRPTTKESIGVNLAAGYIHYANKTLLINSIEKLAGGTFPLSVTAGCDTQEIHLIGGPTLDHQDTLLIPKNSSGPYDLKIYLQSHVSIKNEAEAGNFTYYILPGKGIISVNLPITKNSSNTRQQFVFNKLIFDVSSIQVSTTSSEPRQPSTIKLHFLEHRFKKLWRSIQSISFTKLNAIANASIAYQFEPNTAPKLTYFELPTQWPVVQTHKILKEHLENQTADSLNVTLSDRHELRHALLQLLNKNVAESIEDFKFELKANLSTNTRFYFIDNAELKIGNKNRYLFQQNLNQSVSEIMDKYAPTARRLNLICVLHTLDNEQIVIGHQGKEAMMNNPNARTHLNGNGGEGLFVIKSGIASIFKSSLPLSEVVLHRRPEDIHTDSLDFRALNAQVQTENNMTAKLVFITPNSKNRLGNDMLILFTLVTPYTPAGKHIEVITVRLKDALLNHWHKKYLHIILERMPQQIVGRHAHLHLKPIPLEFDAQHEIASIGVKDIEENTELVLPTTYRVGAFFRHNNTSLLWTNRLSHHSSRVKPFTLIVEKFFLESKLKTLSLQFTDKKIMLSNKLSELNLVEDFAEARNQSLTYLREESLTLMRSNLLDLRLTSKSAIASEIDTLQKHYLINDINSNSIDNAIDDYSGEKTNDTHFFRQRRFVAEISALTSSAPCLQGWIHFPRLITENFLRIAGKVFTTLGSPIIDLSVVLFDRNFSGSPELLQPPILGNKTTTSSAQAQKAQEYSMEARDISLKKCVSLRLLDVNQEPIAGRRCSIPDAKINFFHKTPFQTCPVSFEKPEENYANCRPLEWYGRPSVVCEGEKTTAIVTPHQSQRLFDPINDWIMLGQLIVIKMAKFFTKPAQDTRYQLVDAFSLQQALLWYTKLNTIEQQLRTLQGRVERQKLSWIEYRLEDRQEEFEQFNQRNRVTWNEITAFTENLFALEEMLAEIDEIPQATASHFPQKDNDVFARAASNENDQNNTQHAIPTFYSMSTSYSMSTRTEGLTHQSNFFGLTQLSSFAETENQSAVVNGTTQSFTR
ncbi:MAG: ankyrin repeat domain-containing protein [Candidatus Aquirickettsiella sp.]